MQNYTNRYFKQCRAENMDHVDWPINRQRWQPCIDAVDYNAMCGERRMLTEQEVSRKKLRSKIAYAKRKQRDQGKTIQKTDQERYDELMADFEARIAEAESA